MTSIGSAGRIIPNIRVNADLVLVPVTVIDHRDQLVTGLEKQHFQLFEDKVERAITHFASEDTPVSVVLLFDCSGSMVNKQYRARLAVAEFLRIANPDDEFALVEFGNDARVAVGFTENVGTIQSRLLSVQPKGQTALLDAICLGLYLVRLGKHDRKAIFIISDGGDNHSRYSKREVKNRLREADVQVHSIAIQENGRSYRAMLEEISGPILLDEIARETGGRSFEADGLTDLTDIATKVGLALRNQYLLGYSPASEKKDGKYHRIEVRVAMPGNPSLLRTRFRSGYIAPVE